MESKFYSGDFVLKNKNRITKLTNVVFDQKSRRELTIKCRKTKANNSVDKTTEF